MTRSTTTSKLDPVQIAALDFARDKRGIGWFLQQGLGKTLCALAEYDWYVKLSEADRMIAVCPNSFKTGWLDECEKHGFLFDVHIFQSAKKSAAEQFMNRPVFDRIPLLVINYEALRMAPVLGAVAKWAAKGKTYFAIDESIQIKGHRSQQTRAVHKLAPLCTYVRLLSGRPQTQGPHDLWGQLTAIDLIHQNFFSFQGAFCEMGGWENKEVIGVKNVEILTGIMAPAVFQAKKSDWLPELPRKDYTIRDYAMSSAQRAQYEQMEQEFLLYLEHNVVTVEVAIAKYAKLAQIQTGFIYDEERIVHQLVEHDKNPRLNLLLDILAEEVEGKACIVYRHRAILPVLLNVLADYHPAWISGGMSPTETSAQKARFNDDSDCRIILLQCDAAKYGHTLLAGPLEDDKCRTMIFFENSYSADTRDQIEDRIHRRGQTGENVLYIDLSGSDLDRRIVKALQEKDKMYRKVFGALKVAAPAA